MNRLFVVFFFLCQIAILSACSPDTNSVGCKSQDDCRGTRVCVDGACTDRDVDASPPKDGNSVNDIEEDIDQEDGGAEDIINDAVSDVSETDADVNICPDVCNGGCRNGECHIERRYYNPIQCPDGMDCVVHFDFDRACDQSITCGDSSQCTLRCLGFNACEGAIRCGSAECNIECGEIGSLDYTCYGGIDCGTNSCQVACLDERSCTEGPPSCQDEDCGGAYTCNE